MPIAMKFQAIPEGLWSVSLVATVWLGVLFYQTYHEHLVISKPIKGLTTNATITGNPAKNDPLWDSYPIKITAVLPLKAWLPCRNNIVVSIEAKNTPTYSLFHSSPLLHTYTHTYTAAPLSPLAASALPFFKQPFLHSSHSFFFRGV